MTSGQVTASLPLNTPLASPTPNRHLKQLLKSISEKSNVATALNFRLSCTIDLFSPAGCADDEGWEENYGGDVLTQFSAQAEGHDAH